jgi:hypothetical protein
MFPETMDNNIAYFITVVIMKGLLLMRTLWGVDSAENVDEKLFNCVVRNFGKPKYWGRYLTKKEGANEGLSREEILFLHIKGVRLMPIYNDFTEAIGYRKGQMVARNAIFHARKFKFPNDTPIFANIEHFFKIDEAWVRGWVDAFYTSGYKPAFYHDPVKGDFQHAFCEATKKSERVSLQSILWSAEPGKGVSSEAEAPPFEPNKPNCKSNVWAWQYGRDASECPIDTNLITYRLYQLLW